MTTKYKAARNTAAQAKVELRRFKAQNKQLRKLIKDQAVVILDVMDEGQSQKDYLIKLKTIGAINDIEYLDALANRAKAVVTFDRVLNKEARA